MNKKNLIILVVYLVSAFVFLRTDLSFFSFLYSDPSTILFFALLPPMIWMKLDSKIAILGAILFMILTAIFDLLKFEKASENLAIQSFFFFGYAVYLSFKELKQK